ncbi:putative F-box domain-containing protein [Helianthus annuus]|uniref:F-box domain-containing protein n=1 Tax=Helianthus annuus TaxID=4232 RepID=A0A9K3DYQ2_HELAN|nr:F-box/kelch-repeat protein At3g06240-like [Helianthus annuus]KAF5763082.1 putative F-box domain-containing protein [Helianthus annuus]KAJ0471784.1 putative F-box domain-containing protein [Helianthus annuus]KAJ0647399.1 putative F-box domain-containing protein [Helianthus annuus]KAJ0691892.1 putative F-box domain-containing protein [Helianthus annuus]KAJ0843188.1 putative F-box domain-containing protein [Helianthus annuus]
MMSNDLCEELIDDIFSRLPTKSLLRFRSVSKSLYACIGSPEFIRLHILRSPTEKIMLIHDIREGEKDWRNTYTLHLEDQFPYNINIGITTPVVYHFGQFKILGSCNGIVCLYEFGKSINLWNPSIRRKVNVHYPPSWGNMCFVFEFGFGFDPVIDDYKILRITTPTSFIYTVKTHTWREIAPPTTSAFHTVNSFHCLFNGALHCTVIGNVLDYYYNYYLLKFDLSSEVFSKIELPEPSWETSAVTVIKGSLAVFSSEPDQENSLIWVMRDYSNPASWSVAFKLKTHRLDTAWRVFPLTASDELLLDLYLDKIQVYNPESHERSKFMGLGDSSQVVGFIKCIESLGLLDIGILC